VTLERKLADTCEQIRNLVNLAELTIPTENAGDIIANLNEKVHLLNAINLLTDTERVLSGLEDEYDDVSP
jgi:hypothetical protein